jgi:hypothetical protein
MKCPFCLVEYHDHPKVRFSFQEPVEENSREWEKVTIDSDRKKYLECKVIERHCEGCKKTNITIRRFDKIAISQPMTVAMRQYDQIPQLFDEEKLIYPRYESRVFLSEGIPAPVLEDYTEAWSVMLDSPKASAALSRRCLQTILRQKANVSPSELFFEIQEIIDRKELPSYLNDSIDSIRKIGNIAAHSLKSKSTGSIIDVEPGEAELSITVLEGLLDFYYILPAKQKERLSKIDAKYADADKKPKKTN